MGDEVRLRDVEQADLEVFFEQGLDPEAVRRARFPPRDRERFMIHWRTKVLGDPTVLVQTVTVDGEPAGNVVPGGGRTSGSSATGSAAASGAGASAPRPSPCSSSGRRPAPSTPTRSPATPPRCGCWSDAASAGPGRSGEDEHILLVLAED